MSKGHRRVLPPARLVKSANKTWNGGAHCYRLNAFDMLTLSYRVASLQKAIWGFSLRSCGALSFFLLHNLMGFDVELSVE